MFKDLMKSSPNLSARLEFRRFLELNLNFFNSIVRSGFVVPPALQWLFALKLWNPILSMLQFSQRRHH